jgi:hypothetical protein
MNWQERHDKMLATYLAMSAWWRAQDRKAAPEPVQAHMDCYLDWMENELIDLQRMIDCERATQ